MAGTNEAAFLFDPGDGAEAYFALAQAYQVQSRLGEAIAALERGLEFDRRNAGARQLLARLRGQVLQPQP